MPRPFLPKSFRKITARALAAFCLPLIAAGCATTNPASQPASSNNVQPPLSQAAQRIYDRAAASIVAVQYTLNNEAGRHDYIGEGIVVGDDGLVMISIQLVPTLFPSEQLIDFKIIVPARGQEEETELDATFEGRDERSGVAYVRTKQPQHWTAVKFQDQSAQVGDTIFSVGLLPKIAGYRPYLSEATVSATLRGPIPQVLVSSAGLCLIGSPVFNATGASIGLVNFDGDQTVLLNDSRAPLSAITSPPRLYVPASDFLPTLSDPPSTAHPLDLPWLGVTHVTGLKKDVADYYDLHGQAAVEIGDVIPGYGGAKAGLKPGDKIVQLNHQPLQRGDDPDEAAGIMLRKIQRMKPGQTVVLSLLKGKGEPLQDVTVTLDSRPKQPANAARFYAEDLGFTAREPVAEDMYERKLSANTKGVVISFLRPNASAASAKLQNGDFVTKLNQTPVSDLASFKKQYQDFRREHPKDGVVLEVIRRDGTQVIRIEPPQQAGD